jgi:hypothetical protein
MGDSALTLQKARHGLQDKRLAQRKLANESNSGMPQRVPEQLAIKQEKAANVPICAGVIHTSGRLLRCPRKPGA